MREDRPPGNARAGRRRHSGLFGALGSLLALVVVAALGGKPAVAGSLPNFMTFADPTGSIESYSTTGVVDLSNPFFQSLGTNGRTCATCHVVSDATSVSAAHVQLRFANTQGTDPIFRPVDGANRPDADVSTTAARQAAYSMLLNRGDIRIDLPVPNNAEFSLIAADDPYGYVTLNNYAITGLSLFRRPLPAVNVGFLSAVMWDGRETIQPLSASNTIAANQQALQADLRQQALDATLGHAQATTPPSSAQVQQIVSFELQLFDAQIADNAAGRLDAAGATGGPVNLAGQPSTTFYIGINDPLGGNPTGAAFNPQAMTAFNAWASPGHTAAQQSVARGQAVFNSRQFNITGVGGLNDALGQPSILGTCTTCHDTPNVGNHSLAVPLNIGISDASRRTPDLPLYTLQCNAGPLAGQTFQSTDPGRALITGKCADIGKFKGPVLRGLAGRAPYFHNGSAATLADVVSFYDTRFGIGLTSQDKADLVAFLQAL
jgi:hypothetical protein